MPAKKTGKLVMAPTAVLLDTLERLCEEPSDADLAYLLAVLLVRRRVLTPQDDDFESTETNYLHLTYSSENRELIIPIQEPAPERGEFLQQKLVELLYCES
jgi:hypothetical protein